jgi:hypothetical protein
MNVCNLLIAAKKVIAKHTASNKDHSVGCKCFVCVADGPIIVHEHCVLAYTNNKECTINGVQMTCTCGLLELQKAITAAEDESMNDTEKLFVQLASDRKEEIKSLLAQLSDEDRLDVFHSFCIDCGTDILPCNCKRDE